MADNESFTQRRAQRALQRQLAYQQQKAQKLRGHEPQLISGMTQASAEVRAQLQQTISQPSVMLSVVPQGQTELAAT